MKGFLTYAGACFAFAAMVLGVIIWWGHSAKRERPPPQQSMHHAAPEKQLRSCAMPMQVTAIACAGSSLCFACGSSACWQFVPTRDGCEVLYR